MRMYYVEYYNSQGEIVIRYIISNSAREAKAKIKLCDSGAEVSLMYETSFPSEPQKIRQCPHCQMVEAYEGNYFCTKQFRQDLSREDKDRFIMGLFASKASFYLSDEWAAQILHDPSAKFQIVSISNGHYEMTMCLLSDDGETMIDDATYEYIKRKQNENIIQHCHGNNPPSR